MTSSETPIISVIVPVRNEETLIESALRSLRETSNRFSTEILMVDGSSSDATREKAKTLADRVLLSPTIGRGAQMDFGARNAQGRIFVFLHVDTRLPSDWQDIVAHECPDFFQSPIDLSANGHPSALSAELQGQSASQRDEFPSAASFRLSFDSDRLVYKMIAALAGSRQRITGVPHGDQALIVPREHYFAAGGFTDVPLMEEYVLVPKLKRLGRVKTLNACVVTSSRRYEQKSPLLNSLKNALLLTLFLAGVSPKHLVQWY